MKRHIVVGMTVAFVLAVVLPLWAQQLVVDNSGTKEPRQPTGPNQPAPEGPTIFDCNSGVVDFNDGTFPSGWTAIDNDGNGLIWTNLAGCGEAGNFTDGTGELACASSDIFGLGEPYDTELRSNSLDFTDVISATLEFNANYQNVAGQDFFEVDVSTNGGGSWTNELSWNEDHGGFREPPGEQVSIDLTAYAGQADVTLRWHYFEDINGFDWYIQVDDVELTCEIMIPVEVISFEVD